MRRQKHLKACHFNHSYNNINRFCSDIIIPVEIVSLEDNSYHLITPIEINGIKGDIIIDTGASVTVIDRKQLNEEEIEGAEIRMQSGSVSGQINDVKMFCARNFKIGGVSFKNMQIAAINLDYVNEMYNQHLKRKIIGLLGSDFCVKHKVVIDYQKKILICRR